MIRICVAFLSSPGKIAEWMHRLLRKKLPPVRCDDESTWRHKYEEIDLRRLLQLIEQNGGPRDLDLHGCYMGGLTGIDASPEALRPYVDAYAQKHGADAKPPWLAVALSDIRGVRGINLDSAHLERAILDITRFEHADLSFAHLENANLSFAHLERALLPGAHLENANLDSAHLEHAVLHLAHLENASLNGAHLQDASLYLAHLENASLVGAQLRGAFWNFAYLDRTRIRRESLGPAVGEELGAKGRDVHWFTAGDFHGARESYLTLKTNFHSIGRYDDASWAYVKEQQMEKAMHFPTTAGHRWIRSELRIGARRWRTKNPSHLRRFVRRSILGRLQWTWLHLRLFVGLCPREVRQEMARRDEYGGQRDEWLSRWRWARNWAYELLTGYGERPWNPLIIGAISILAFAIGYFVTRAVSNFVDALVFSIATFATFNLTTPSAQPKGTGADIASSMEALLGIFILALFVFTLGNRMSRS